MSDVNNLGTGTECNCGSLEDSEQDLNNPPKGLDDDILVELTEISLEATETEVTMRAALESVAAIGDIFHQAETLSKTSTKEVDIQLLNSALGSEYRRLQLEGPYLELDGGGVSEASMESVFDWLGKVLDTIGKAWKGFMENMSVGHAIHSRGLEQLSSRVANLRTHLQKVDKFEASKERLTCSTRRTISLMVGRAKVAKSYSTELGRLDRLHGNVVKLTADASGFSNKIYQGLGKAMQDPARFEGELKRLVAGAPNPDTTWKVLADGKGQYAGRLLLVPNHYSQSAHVPSWFADFQRFVEFTPITVTEERSAVREAMSGVDFDCLSSDAIATELSAIESAIDSTAKHVETFNSYWAVSYKNWDDCSTKVNRVMSVSGAEDFSRAQLTLVRIAMLSGEYNCSRLVAVESFVGTRLIATCDAILNICEQSYLKRPR